MPAADLGGEDDGLRQRRVRVDRERDVLGVRAHLDRVHGLGDQLAGVDADDAGAEHAPRLGLDDELRQPVRRGPAPARGRTPPTGTSPTSYLDAVGLRLRLGQPDPGDLGVGVGDRRDRARVERRRSRPRSPRPRPCPRAWPCGRASARRRRRRSRRCAATFVRICASTRMKPRSSTSTPAASAPIVARRSAGGRPRRARGRTSRPAPCRPRTSRAGRRRAPRPPSTLVPRWIAS